MLRNNSKYFSYYAWFFLAFNLYVVLGGAFVRGTGSGAGCGAHWPLCNGSLIPEFTVWHTLVEYVHRVSSGFIGLGTILLLLWVYSLKHSVTLSLQRLRYLRFAATAVLILVIFESLFGAGLVLFKLVADNASGMRSVVMSVHLVSTFFLLAALFFTAIWSSNFQLPRFTRQGNKLLFIALAIVLVLLIGTTGAITALGDTLFKPTTVGADFLPTVSAGTEHFLKSLRIYHPVIAIVGTVYILLLVWKLLPQEVTRRQFILAVTVTCIFILQIAAGFANVFLLAPLWMQLVHLLIGNLTWLMLLLFFNVILAE